MFLTDWLGTFDSNQQIFAKDELVKSVTYLKGARNPGQGWGPYPRLPTDSHHSALAVQALSSLSDPSYQGVIADVASYFRSGFSSDVGSLSLEKICDLLTILRADGRPDEELQVQLINELPKIYDNLIASGEARALVKVSLTLLAVSESSANLQLANALTNHLVDYQRPDGAWPALSGGEVSLVTTAVTLRSLGALASERAQEARQRGLIFLYDYISRFGWGAVGKGEDVFTRASVLWTLASVPSTDYDLIRSGIESLKKLRNDDGSWGSFEGQVGNIEATSLSLLALVASGENSYVPARLAKAAVYNVQADLTTVTEERDKLKEEFETNVTAECGAVVIERNRLLTENKRLQAEITEERKLSVKAENDLEQAEIRMSNLERELYLLGAMRRKSEMELGTHLLPETLLSSRIASIILIPMPLLFAITLIYIFLQWPPNWWRIIVYLMVLSTAAASSWILYRWSVFQSLATGFERAPEVLNDSAVSSLRRMYMDIMAELPPAIREEFAYRLLTTMTSMSAEIGERYAEELTFRIDIPSYLRSRLTGWIRYALRLSPTDRRVLFDSLLRLTTK